MEFLVFFAIVSLGAIVLLWRSRRRTTSWRESPNAFHSHDTNLTRLANAKVESWNGDQTDDALLIGHQPPRRVSREDGHGKDGGG